jgi:tRNA pseudouridine38-40 synthase
MGVIRLTIAYDGGPFAGWAAQPELPTVQGELEAALERILGAPVGLTVAGRTDAGVHAWGQVASFELDDEPPAGLARSLNALLPKAISVLDLTSAPAGFDARRDARSRTYCYWVVAAPVLSPFERGRALWWPHPLDRTALDRCAALVPGVHDFTAFTPSDSEHVRFERRVLGCEWRRFPLAEAREGELLELWIEADAFMRHMVRVVVGTMLEVGAGRRSVDDFAALLEGTTRERAGETAPAHGLYLASVRYQR